MGHEPVLVRTVCMYPASVRHDFAASVGASVKHDLADLAASVAASVQHDLAASACPDVSSIAGALAEATGSSAQDVAAGSACHRARASFNAQEYGPDYLSLQVGDQLLCLEVEGPWC